MSETDALVVTEGLDVILGDADSVSDVVVQGELVPHTVTLVVTEGEGESDEDTDTHALTLAEGDADAEIVIDAQPLSV